MTRINGEGSYFDFFQTLWGFLKDNPIIFDIQVLQSGQDNHIFTPLEIQLPFFFWQERQPLVGRIDMGWLCLQEVLKATPTTVNLLLILNALTCGGRIGVAMSLATLEKLAQIGFHRALLPLQFLREKRLLTWGFVVHKEKKGAEVRQIFWLNRERIIL